ncbi:unnamed protein product [Penicillium camemberti]|uniref:Str. FM013 n=1 Tax=Penicillium camemberti (strain FM 013) TaxID=1429867 RepID=A0A0G4NWC9_PENC3|nr:unnamed protein product [Penicillium camemberti]
MVSLVYSPGCLQSTIQLTIRSVYKASRESYSPLTTPGSSRDKSAQVVQTMEALQPIEPDQFPSNCWPIICCGRQVVSVISIV